MHPMCTGDDDIRDNLPFNIKIQNNSKYIIEKKTTAVKNKYVLKEQLKLYFALEISTYV